MKQMSINKSDGALVASAALFILVVGESLYWLHSAPVGARFSTKEAFEAWKEMYEVVVRGTMLSLFTLLVGLKIGYTVAVYALNKLSDK